jgi:F0F1-type ATP synthase membrane subunit c/vacuolar-type H+-ATPase subunit K
MTEKNQADIPVENASEQQLLAFIAKKMDAQTKYLRSIKSSVTFFEVLAIIGLIVGFITVILNLRV